jgi:hypothetical protein
VRGLDIPSAQWSEASGGYVVDERGQLWRIVGFIDRPTVILDPVRVLPEPGTVTVTDKRQRQYLIMGSPNSKEFQRLIPEE